MLCRLTVKRFKSIGQAVVDLPRLAVLFGPNAAGKSNLLDAVQALSRLGTERTLSDAMSEPIRGHPIEAFAFPDGGLSDLLSEREASFELEADLQVGGEPYRYRVRVSIGPSSGALSVADEYLTRLTKKGEPKGTPSIERVDQQLRIRRKSKPAHPRQEPVGLNHTILSDPRLGGIEYKAIERCRQELMGWRMYYLDPRVSMRAAKPPADVSDIGVLGENTAPFLYRLKGGEHRQRFEAIKRTMRSLVPTVEDIEVDLDKRRGTLDILVRQNGRDFSSRIISEGTLRVLALCCVAVNPWGGSVIAFEEPENGVHPRRIELIAQLLASMAGEHRQVIVTSHSPVFCDAVLRASKSDPHIALLNVRHEAAGTEVVRFESGGPLFRDAEMQKALADAGENGVFEALVMRGLIDG